MHAVASLMCRARGRDNGNAVIELALTLPLLLLIVTGVFDFGLMFQRFEVVTNAAREGARVGVLPGYTTADAAARAMQYLSVGGVGATAGSCGALAPGEACATAAVATTTITGTSKTVSDITVTVQYIHQYRWVGPIMGLFGSSLGQVTLAATSTMRREGS